VATSGVAAWLRVSGNYGADGFTYDSLPAGMTILGRSFNEGLLIKYAYAYE
jgi:Asp-tRNA(Asn)/Glu-tRNA(Gln) amidotransferase A subunit family amidase